MDHELVEMFRKRLDSLTISDYHGLTSPGLTCYLNSVLQVLFMTVDFQEAIKRSCREDSPTIDPHLGRLFADLEKHAAKTDEVIHKLGITDVYQQRDAAEYFEKILSLTSLEASKIFKGELNHRTTCLHCKERSDSTSRFWILPLPVEVSRLITYRVEAGLKSFFKKEKVCGDNKMYCNQCDKKRDAKIECKVTHHPQILTLLLKRFTFDYRSSRYVKLHCEVDVPQTLSLEGNTYDLYAVVHHFGNLTGGHYTAQIQSYENREWYHFNDITVDIVNQQFFGFKRKSFRSCTAYLLMYRKVNKHPEQADEGGQEPPIAHSAAEAEGRRDAAERGEARAQLDSCRGGGTTVTHFNGDTCRKRDDEMLRNNPAELTKHMRSRRETLPGTDAAADRVAKVEKHREGSYRPSRPRDEANPENRRTQAGHSGTMSGGRLSEQRHHSQSKTLKVNETVWETQGSSGEEKGTKTSTCDRSRAEYRGKLGKKTGAKNIREAKESLKGRIIKQRERCHSSSHSNHPEQQQLTSPILHRKSSNSKRIGGKVRWPLKTGWMLEASQALKEKKTKI